MLKLVVTTAIITLGIAGAYFVIDNSFPVFPDTNNAEIKISDNNAVKGIPKIEQLNSKTLSINNSSENTANSSSENSAENNLTELVASQIGKTIAQQNPTGPQTIDGKKSITAPDAESIANDLLTEAVEKFDPASLYPEIKDSDLKISKDNSKEALTAYFSAFKEILSEAVPQIANSVKDSNEMSMQIIENLSKIYGDTAKKLISLASPQNAIEIHKKEIELLTAKKNIFEKIKNMENDPITAMLATKELENIDIETKALTEKLSDFLNKNGLSL